MPAKKNEKTLQNKNNGARARTSRHKKLVTPSRRLTSFVKVNTSMTDGQGHSKGLFCIKFVIF